MCSVEDVDEAIQSACTALWQLREADWSRPAGELTWTCRQVLVHVADDLIAYAAQLITGAANAHVPLTVDIEQEADPAAAVQTLRAAAGLFTATLRTAPAGASGWHPYGRADVEATAARGIVEVLVHTGDICTGLDLQWQGPARACTAALHRLFPDATGLLEEHAPWEVLQWATGRAGPPGHARRTQWHWYNEQPVS
ncbi:maleylpyruvate isomerase N-terminal domain-containing protein [Kineococcus sp. SYSU DK006]|uniref:maleylpyruvate isomerase N-terminal domain-containing protein n=1 Tax=Kineococcus sp. SYSU DK006 TaxID=3383127 RepID=UPI003D7D72A1